MTSNHIRLTAQLFRGSFFNCGFYIIGLRGRKKADSKLKVEILNYSEKSTLVMTKKSLITKYLWL